MEKAFNYRYMFEQALQRVKSIRDPRATRPETADLRWHDVEKEVLFDFCEPSLKKYSTIADAANEITMSCLQFIIKQLMPLHGFSIREIVTDNEHVQFCLLVEDTKELLLFKTIEECPFWKLPNKETKDVQAIMDSCKAVTCKHIYFLHDNAYLQVIGHNDDENDPGRGYNVYSLKWFFVTYFGEEEYRLFDSEIRRYIVEANDYIGYNVIKSLTPSSLVNFSRITENELAVFPYEKLINTSAKQFELIEEEYEKIRKQFVDNRIFHVMTGEHDFAESLVTSEWLFDSMKKAKAIDLTIIGMGYFKSVEQLLYELLCLHGYDDEPQDATLGAMAMFFRDNLEMLRGDLVFKTRKYIREKIFEYKDLRNGYFHKDNIHKWDVIKDIRQETLNILFLLLGSFDFSDSDLKALGYKPEAYSDYYKLCEYVNFHSGELFYLKLNDDEDENMASGHFDPQSYFKKGLGVVYSGVFFKELGKGGRVIRFSEEQVPKEISIGKFVFGYDDGIKVTPVKVKKIFENGSFVGPSIVDEEGLDY